LQDNVDNLVWIWESLCSEHFRIKISQIVL